MDGPPAAVKQPETGSAKQIGVGSRPGQVQILAVDLVDKYPIRRNVAISEMLPIAAQRMIPATIGERNSFRQQANCLTQLRHILAVCSHPLYVPLKSSCRNYFIFHISSVRLEVE